MNELLQYYFKIHVNVQEVVLVVALLIYALALHEVGHAWVALKLGDPTARDRGRITFNPIPHIDPLLTVVVPVLTILFTPVVFGGAKPVPVDASRFKHPARGMMLVALAGPLTNFLLAIGFAVAIRLGVQGGWLDAQSPDDSFSLYDVFRLSVLVNLALTFFNLLPIPPLDGSRVVAWLLPSRIRAVYNASALFAMLLLVAALLMGWGSRYVVWFLYHAYERMFHFVADLW